MHILRELDRIEVELSTAASDGRSSVVLDGLREERAEMRRTLDRVDDLAYGVCEVCHAFIGIDRLMALPATTRCMRCAR
jgi:RNA polymerase-binding transcription factor DksA